MPENTKQTDPVVLSGVVCMFLSYAARLSPKHALPHCQLGRTVKCFTIRDSAPGALLIC